MQEQSIENQITELQNQYYANNQKSRFWGANIQKLDCAALISNKFEKSQLFSQSAYIIPNTNHIFIDYQKFKPYGCPEIYEEYIDHLLQLINACLVQYKMFEIHVNMYSFTPTAAQRYKELIFMLIHKCLMQSSELSQKVSIIYLYNPPKMIDTIMKLFSGLVSEDIKQKMVLINT